MSKLSLFIYLADIAQTLQGWCIGLAILSAIVLIAYGVIYLCCIDNGSKYSVPKRWIGCTAFITILFIVMSCIVPTKKTIYIIAAIEATKTFTESSIGQETATEAKMVLKDVGSIIHRYAKGEDEDGTQSRKRSNDED